MTLKHTLLIYFIAIIACFVHLTVHAAPASRLSEDHHNKWFESIRPVISLRGGVDIAEVGGTTQYQYFAPPARNKPNRYIPDKWHTGGVWGGLLGVEFPVFSEGNRWQTGVSYYQSFFVPSGKVEEQSEPSEIDLAYKYKVRNERILWENRWLTAVDEWFEREWLEGVDLYAMIGIGWSRNEAYGYNERSIDPTALHNEYFTDDHKEEFTYSVGLGIEVALTHYLRAGVGYQFSELGRVQLGHSPDQRTDADFSTAQTPTNEILASLTYIY